jgi:spore coat polysaccharide biosynthesis predicted glycosyltransferase SpsG
MNRDPILFRVDGIPSTGWERLCRCMVYAAALQRRRRPTYFLTQLEPRSLVLPIKRTGSEWLDADGPAGTSEDATETIQEIRRIRPAAVIVDAAGASQPYLTELAATGTLVMSIDHLGTTRFPSQMVVNPLLAPGREGYEFFPGTQLLLGARYAIIRSEVRRVRPTRSQEPPPPFRALVALGDDDTELKALDITRHLLGIAKLERIDVAVRPEHPLVGQLQELAGTQGERLKVLAEPAELAASLARCHFAVTSAGMWSLELACVGVPQLLVVLSEAYWPTAQRLEEEGAANCLGAMATLSGGTLRQAVQNLLAEPLERQAMARCGRQLIDGRGPDRLVTALEVMLHPSRQLQFDSADVAEAA